MAHAWPATFLLRIDCEHTEALRWSGSAYVEIEGLRRLLGLLRELEVPATCAFVGLTAIRYPELVRACREDGHAIAGHSMRHAAPYAGQPEALQRADMATMVAAIQKAAGVRVRGLAAPCHGAIDGATLRAAAAAGLDYVLNFTITADCAAPLGPAPPGHAPVLVPSSRLNVLWDWTPLQPGWPPFSAAEATQRWTTAIDAATAQRGYISLIVHPWIVESNQEYGVLRAVLAHVRSTGSLCATFDEVARSGDAGRTPSVM